MALVVSMLVLASAAAAHDDTLWAEEHDELARLDRELPDAVELLQFGERALAEGDYAAAAARFAEARAFAPRAALPARRHCQALVALEQRHDALVACAAAFDQGRTEHDQRVLVSLLASGAPSRDHFALWLVGPIILSLTLLGAVVLLVRARRARRGARLPSRAAARAGLAVR